MFLWARIMFTISKHDIFSMKNKRTKCIKDFTEVTEATEATKAQSKTNIDPHGTENLIILELPLANIINNSPH